MKELIVRQAEAPDGEGIFQVEKQCFDDPWSRDAFRKELTENDIAFYLVAEIGGDIVGYAGLWVVGDEGHITNVAVHPDYRGKSVGSALVHTLLDYTIEVGLRRHTLEVRPSNEGALALYKKFGFVEAGRRPGYYSDTGEDAIIMWRGEEEE
ncbi:MAG: ribosomal protein S18-alanine N-acetyltransferase [Anaerovoracaceae bacterium]|jgi:ribosomal-protein-alanine N-acetyltransferase